MEFELWHSLDEIIDWNNKENDLNNMFFNTNIKIIESNVDNEGIYKARISLDKDDPMESLKELAYLLNDNIVIYGSDSDILMTVKTMNELGLD